MRALTLSVYATNDISECVEDFLELLALLLKDLPLGIFILISICVVVRGLLDRDLITKENNIFTKFLLEATI